MLASVDFDVTFEVTEFDSVIAVYRRVSKLEFVPVGLQIALDQGIRTASRDAAIYNYHLDPLFLVTFGSDDRSLGQVRLGYPRVAPHGHGASILVGIFQVLCDGGVGAGLNLACRLDGLDAKITEGDEEQDGEDNPWPPSSSQSSRGQGQEQDKGWLPVVDIVVDLDPDAKGEK